MRSRARAPGRTMKQFAGRRAVSAGAVRFLVMVQFESVFLNTRLGSLVNPQAGMPALRP